MTLTWPVLAAVLCAALLHALWNALVKSSTDKTFDTALIHLLGSVVAIPLVALAGWPDRAAWPFIATSLVLHIGYYTALSGAYQHGDLGLTYPLMRGTAPLLVALSATFTLGETLSPLSWVGVLGISAGVLTLGLSPHAFAAPKAVQFALVNAVIIATYTVVDALGVRAGGNAIQYVTTLFLLDGWLGLGRDHGFGNRRFGGSFPGSGFFHGGFLDSCFPHRSFFDSDFFHRSFFGSGLAGDDFDNR